MNITEIYLLLFTDTLTGNLCFNISSELVIGSMKIFGNYNNAAIISIATPAFIIAAVINYIFGRICYKILAPWTPRERRLSEKRIAQLNNNSYVLLLLIFSCVPFFGKFILFLAGFSKLNFKNVIVIAAITKLIYYTIFIIT